LLEAQVPDSPLPHAAAATRASAIATFFTDLPPRSECNPERLRRAAPCLHGSDAP
jgi:hypothetical protein